MEGDKYYLTGEGFSADTRYPEDIRQEDIEAMNEDVYQASGMRFDNPRVAFRKKMDNMIAQDIRGNTSYFGRVVTDPGEAIMDLLDLYFKEGDPYFLSDAKRRYNSLPQEKKDSIDEFMLGMYGMTIRQIK